MKMKHSRFILAAVFIAAALLLCFVVSPLLSRAVTKQVTVLRVLAPVEQGNQVTRANLETVTVPALGLPAQVLTEEELILGKYANADLYAGDYFFSQKLSNTPLLANEYLLALGDKLAVSVTLKSFAAGLSAKLEPDDIVTVYYTYDSVTTDTAFSSPELRYVKVLAVTTPIGQDMGGVRETNPMEAQEASTNSSDTLPATVTLLVTPRQAALLTGIEARGKVQLALACRGAENKEAAKALLEEQHTILAAAEEPLENEENSSPPDTTPPASSSEPLRILEDEPEAPQEEEADDE